MKAALHCSTWYLGRCAVFQWLWEVTHARTDFRGITLPHSLFDLKPILSNCCLSRSSRPRFSLSTISFAQTRTELLWPGIAETILVRHLPGIPSSTKGSHNLLISCKLVLGLLLLLLFLSCHIFESDYSKTDKISTSFHTEIVSNEFGTLFHTFCPRACPFSFPILETLFFVGAPFFWQLPVSNLGDTGLHLRTRFTLLKCCYRLLPSSHVKHHWLWLRRAACLKFD